MMPLSLYELEENVKHIERQESKVTVNGEKQKPIKEKFVYFMPNQNDIRIRYSNNSEEYIVSLMHENYGFPNSRIVKLKGFKAVLFLSQEAEEKYNKHIGRKKASLNESLETIAKCINDSIKFDIEMVENNYKTGKLGWQDYKELVRILKESNYMPNGNETISGVCEDAGRFIRKILRESVIDDNLRYMRVSARSKISRHDTTTVFDIKTREWAVVNSKSPLKQYNLVPNEKLEELGYPYSSK
jgi:hypothetical protein